MFLRRATVFVTRMQRSAARKCAHCQAPIAHAQIHQVTCRTVLAPRGTVCVGILASCTEGALRSPVLRRIRSKSASVALRRSNLDGSLRRDRAALHRQEQQEQKKLLLVVHC